MMLQHGKAQEEHCRGPGARQKDASTVSRLSSFQGPRPPAVFASCGVLPLVKDNMVKWGGRRAEVEGFEVWHEEEEVSPSLLAIQLRWQAASHVYEPQMFTGRVLPAH